MPGGHHSFPGIISFYIQLVTPSAASTSRMAPRFFYLKVEVWRCNAIK